MADAESGPRETRREPMVNAPAAVVVLALALVGIHLGLWLSSEAVQDAILRQFAFLPGRLTVALWPQRLAEALATGAADPDLLERARALRDFLAESGGVKPWTLVSYALLHGSWTHVGLNTIWLFAFGPPIARRFGTARFFAFFVVTAAASALAHWASAPMDFMPLIGASGADSGLMAAAARFMFEPGAPLGPPVPYDARLADPVRQTPAPPLLRLTRDRRALIFIGLWLATNFIFGFGAQTLDVSEAPIAWIAHLGGFFAGLLLFPLFDRPPS